jgi:hypothetical protein
MYPSSSALNGHKTKHGRSYAKSVAAALARGYPKEQTRRSSSAQKTKFNKPQDVQVMHTPGCQ